MGKHAHKPPSRIRYEAKHPTVTIRVTSEIYEQLKELHEKSGKSLGDILREALKKQLPGAKAAFQLGFDAAKARYAVTYNCSVCRESTTLDSDSEKKAAARYMGQNNWGHRECHERMNHTILS